MALFKSGYPLQQSIIFILNSFLVQDEPSKTLYYHDADRARMERGDTRRYSDGHNNDMEKFVKV